MKNQPYNQAPMDTGGQPQLLNVIIHGLWGIETNKDGIRLTTPHVHNHFILAGRMAHPEIELTPPPEG